MVAAPNKLIRSLVLPLLLAWARLPLLQAVPVTAAVTGLGRALPGGKTKRGCCLQMFNAGHPQPVFQM